MVTIIPEAEAREKAGHWVTHGAQTRTAWDNAGTSITSQISEPLSPKAFPRAIHTKLRFHLHNLTLHLGEETRRIHLNSNCL